MSVLSTIFIVMFSLCEFYLIYNAILAVVAFFCPRPKYKMVDDKQKFCIFVPCHNEGSVIKATVENYININYDKNLFDIFFIADNCSDDTAKEIQNAINENKIDNFYLFERNVDDPKKKGKPHALRWVIDKLEQVDKFYNKYDMFMILDADNFVDPDILRHINSQYLSYKENKRPVMIQTYLDSKNKNSLVARSYYTAYRVTNRFFQLPHHSLGLNLAIGGTGFAMTTDFLKEIGGYNCQSLTEDLEIQSIATLKGKRIVHNINTRVYDEKPTGVKQAYIQRTRWAQGHWFLFFKYYMLLFINLFNFKTIKSTFRKIDQMIYLTSFLNVTLAFLTSIYGIVLACLNVPIPLPRPLLIFNLAVAIFYILLIPISSLYDGTKQEKKRILIDFLPNVISMFVLSYIIIFSAIRGLFLCGNQRTWAKTKHRVTEMEDGNASKANTIKNAKQVKVNSSPESELELEAQI